MNIIETANRKIHDISDGIANHSKNDAVHDKGSNARLWYAEWEDRDSAIILNSKPVIKCMQRIVDSYYGSNIEPFRRNATELTKDSYPSLFEVYSHCCMTLGMENPPQAFVSAQMHGIGALCLEVQRKAFVLVSLPVSYRLPPSEAAFLLGHELGHFQQGNLACHVINDLMLDLQHYSETLGTMLNSVIEVPYKRWRRQSELNADRAGYLCCRDYASVESLFSKLYGSHPVTRYADLTELYGDHPFITTRLEKIREFEQSKLLQI